jgi:hypothetical protein
MAGATVELRSYIDLAAPDEDFENSIEANPRGILSQKRRKNFGQEYNSLNEL